MKIVYIMDPLETLLPDKDTTFAFLRSGVARGYQNLHTDHAHLYLAQGEVRAQCREAFVSDEAPHYRYGKSIDIALSEVDAVFIRKDPPFNDAYLHMTLLLERARGKTLILNDPRGLRDANEKLYTLNFAEWMPRTLVSADKEQILAFMRQLGGTAVIKPLDGAGGWGVLGLREGDHNVRGLVDMTTHEGKRLAMVQEYLPEVRIGDKRILLLDGEPLGAILRVPRSDDLRSNIHVGGSVVEASLTAREKAMVAAVAPRLRQDGLVFVGLDVIGERLTEVNVTSPTGIQQLGKFQNAHPEDRVLDWIEGHRVGR